MHGSPARKSLAVNNVRGACVPTHLFTHQAAGGQQYSTRWADHDRGHLHPAFALAVRCVRRRIVGIDPTGTNYSSFSHLSDIFRYEMSRKSRIDHLDPTYLCRESMCARATVSYRPPPGKNVDLDLAQKCLQISPLLSELIHSFPARSCTEMLTDISFAERVHSFIPWPLRVRSH